MSVFERLRRKPQSTITEPLSTQTPASPAKVICWDLDDTIGDFRGYRLQRVRGAETFYPIKLRYGIGNLLNDFSEDTGYVHYITSSAGDGYIGDILRRVQLDNKFKKIYGRETVVAEKGKKYGAVAKDNQFSDSEAKAHMIAIGNNELDRPVDIDGMVFVEMPLEVEALVVREIITTLLEKGEGDFHKGFASLYSQASTESTDISRSKKRIAAVGNDISFIMEYKRGEFGDTRTHTIPTISNIRTDTHRQDPVPFF